MPVMSGLEAAREIAKYNLPSKVLVLSMHELHYKIEDLVRMGIRGYVLKSDAVRDLTRALDELSGGGTFLNQPNQDAASSQISSKRMPGMFCMALSWA
jgi:two-component system, NarL family, response regulator DesR